MMDELDGRSWRVEIPDWRPTTVNELVGIHRMVAARRKRVDADMIKAYTSLAGVPPATGRRRVGLEIRRNRGRALDEDNVWKSLLDGLVKAGLLVDDSPRWCERDRATFPKGDRSTTITLTDIGGEMTEIKVTCDRCKETILENRVAFDVRCGALRQRRESLDFCHACIRELEAWLAQGKSDAAQ